MREDTRTIFAVTHTERQVSAATREAVAEAAAQGEAAPWNVDGGGQAAAGSSAGCGAAACSCDIGSDETAVCYVN